MNSLGNIRNLPLVTEPRDGRKRAANLQQANSNQPVDGNGRAGATPNEVS